MKRLLAAGAVALLVFLAVYLLGTGEVGGVPLPQAAAPGSAAGCGQLAPAE